MHSLKNILIIKLSSIGDVVHALPFLEVLRDNYPGAQIDWLVEEDAFQVIYEHPALIRIIVSRMRSWQNRFISGHAKKSIISEISRFIKEIWKYKYDLVIDLQGLFKSGILAGLSRGHRKICMDGAREAGWIFMSERPVQVNHHQHAIDRYLEVARYLNCNFVAPKGHIYFSDTDKKRVDHILSTKLKGKGPIIAINPVARWKTKLWEPERFSRLADRLIGDFGYRVVFTGSANDIPTVAYISNRMMQSPLNLAGQMDLKKLAYLYTRCAALITTDTGPMHIASAMRCNVVALFGPTDPLLTGPYGEGHQVVRISDLECSPCFRKRCDSIICMKRITVEMVLQAIERLSVGY